MVIGPPSPLLRSVKFGGPSNRVLDKASLGERGTSEAVGDLSSEKMLLSNGLGDGNNGLEH